MAIKQLRKEHELGLIGRKLRGKPERPGWLEGLEIVFEELDVDKVGGRGGILDFAARIKAKYVVPFYLVFARHEESELNTDI